MMKLHLLVLIFSLIGVNGFIMNAGTQSKGQEKLRECIMMNSTGSAYEEFVKCMGRSDMPEPSLCGVILNGFQCNLDFILKACPSSATFYKQNNYYTVRTCNSSFQLPGNLQPVTASGNNIGVSMFTLGLAVVIPLTGISLLG